MKKRIGTIIAALMVLMIATTATCFAADFRIESTSPEDGAKGTTKENLCVKIFFSQPVGNEESVEANKDAFRIVDEEGKEFPALIYYNKEDPTYALILADTTKIPESGKEAIQDATKYTCIIDGSFRDNDGDTLGEEKRISFTTMNQGQGMIIYMVLMVGMMVAMMGATFWQTKKEAEEQAKENAKDASYNPYKEAKETGKTVEQVIAEHEKKDKKGKKAEAALEQKEEKKDGDCYRVKRPQPISAAGSTYKTGRKAKAEAEAARLEAEKQQRKADGYSKKKSDKPEPDNKKKKKGGRK